MALADFTHPGVDERQAVWVSRFIQVKVWAYAAAVIHRAVFSYAARDLLRKSLGPSGGAGVSADVWAVNSNGIAIVERGVSF